MADEQYLPDDDLTALSGTVDGDTGLLHPTQNENPHSIVNYKALNQITRGMTAATALQVYKDADLTYGVRAGRFNNVDATVSYVASTGNALTNNATNYIYLVRDGTLTINTTGFPTPGVTPHVPLAEIVTAAGVYAISAITDRRVLSMFQIVGISAWDDLRVPLTALNMGGANAPDFAAWLDNGAGSRGVYAPHFDAAAEEELFFAAQLPHNYKEGSDISAHIHWTPSANGGATQVVSWGLEYVIGSIGDIYGNTTIISGNTHAPADDPIVAPTHYYSELGTISGTGLTISAQLVGRIFRDAGGVLKTDDYPDDAVGLEIDFHHEIDSHGSASEWVK